MEGMVVVFIIVLCILETKIIIEIFRSKYVQKFSRFFFSHLG